MDGLFLNPASTLKSVMMPPRISRHLTAQVYNICQGEADQKWDILTRRERHVSRSKAQDLWYKEGKHASGVRCTSRSVCLGPVAALWLLDPSAPINPKLSVFLSKTQEWLLWYYWPILPPQYRLFSYYWPKNIYWIVKPGETAFFSLFSFVHFIHIQFSTRYMQVWCCALHALCRCVLGHALEAHELAVIQVSRYRGLRHIRSYKLDYIPTLDALCR